MASARFSAAFTVHLLLIGPDPRIIGKRSDEVNVLSTNDRQLSLCQITAGPPGVICRGWAVSPSESGKSRAACETSEKPRSRYCSIPFSVGQRAVTCSALLNSGADRR